MFNNCLIVGVGGFIGSVGRYLLGSWLVFLFPDRIFPLGTFVVNLIGCLAIGLVSGAADQLNAISEQNRLLLVTGVLGGFTTFSAFGLESFTLLKNGQYFLTFLSVFGQVIIGIALVGIGHRIITGG